ncbi:MAG: hypothetical protein ACRC1W_01250 [Shewanella sp.]
MKKITPGQKVKVYADNKKSVQFGEVLGVDIECKIILAHRPDFKNLRASEFDLFRDMADVRFLNNGAQLPIVQWTPIKSI